MRPAWDRAGDTESLTGDGRRILLGADYSACIASNPT